MPVMPSIAVQAPGDAAAASPIDSLLGNGLVSPFVRTQSDFSSARGIELVRSGIRRIIGIRGADEISQGELRWRTEFGSLLGKLRHQNNDDVLADIARVYVADAIARWEPRIVITGLDISRFDTKFGVRTGLQLIIHFALINQNVPGNRVFLATDKVEVDMQLAA